MNNMTSKELKQLAKEHGIKNWWNLKKSELIAALQELQDEPEQQPKVEDNSLYCQEEADLTAQSEANENIVEEENGWEKIAKENIKYAYDWITGENENVLQDYEEDSDEYKASYNYLHSGNEIMDVIYHEAITTEYGEGYCGGKAPSEMRFAGKAFCMAYIKELLTADGYLKDEDEITDTLNEYIARVRIKGEKEASDITGKAKNKGEFYLELKAKGYKVRFITTPEKFEETCKNYEVGHARNKKLKNEKYAADKVKAKEMNMTVAEYRKWVREHE